MRDFVQRRDHLNEAVGGNPRGRVRRNLVKETQGKHERTDEFMTVSVSRREMIGSNYASLLQFEGIVGIEILSIHLLASTIVCRAMASKIEIYGHVPTNSAMMNSFSIPMADLQPETAALCTSLSRCFRCAGSLTAAANQAVHTAAEQVVANSP